MIAPAQRSAARRPPLAWDDVPLFLALYRARTAGAAAAALGVDPSTVSRRLSALEAALGASLFSRGRDGVAPAEAAERLLPIAEELEAAMARFAGAAEGLERSPSGLVRIACPPDLAEVVVAPLVPALRARHPALRLELDPGEAVRDLARREADLALRTVRPARGDLVVTRLRTVRWVLVATPAVARSLGRLRAWTGAPWIGWGDRLAEAPPARWLARHAADLEPAVRTDSLLLQVALVRQGAGVALLPEPSATHYGLVPVAIAPALRPAAAAWPVGELFLVAHQALRPVPRVRAVWDLLVERVADRSGVPSSTHVP